MTFRRNRFYCPPEFEEWIEITNMCPTPNELFKIEREMDRYVEDFIIYGAGAEDDFIENWLKTKLQPKLSEFCIGKTSKGFVWDFVREVFRIADIIRLATKQAEKELALSGQMDEIPALETVPRYTKVIDTFWENSVTLDENPASLEQLREQFRFGGYNLLQPRLQGKFIISNQVKDSLLKPVKSNFIGLLENNDIDIRNLRFCRNCLQVFWLTRKKQITCSKKCRDAYQTRKHRQNKKEGTFKRPSNGENQNTKQQSED